MREVAIDLDRGFLMSLRRRYCSNYLYFFALYPVLHCLYLIRDALHFPSHI